MYGWAELHFNHILNAIPDSGSQILTRGFIIMIMAYLGLKSSEFSAIQKTKNSQNLGRKHNFYAENLKTQKYN